MRGCLDIYQRKRNQGRITLVSSLRMDSWHMYVGRTRCCSRVRAEINNLMDTRQFKGEKGPVSQVMVEIINVIDATHM